MADEAWILLGPLVAAAGLVAARGAIGGLPEGAGLTTRVGPVNFDFSKSFASTITALGALLTSIISAKVTLSPAPHLPAASYAALSLFFGVVVVVAPLVHRALSVTTDVTSAQGVADIQTQGFAGSFLASSALTTWAVLGQVVTIFFFITDIQSSVVFETLLVVMLVASVLLVGLYVWTTIPAVLHIQAKAAAHEAALRTQLRMAQVPNADTMAVTAPLPTWQAL